MELSRRLTILNCENCGRELPEGASFCARCGSLVSVAQIGPVYVPQTAPPAEEIPGPQHFTLVQANRNYAGFWLRAVAFMIDRFILSSIFGLIASFYPTVLMIFPNPNTQPVAAPNQLTLQGFLLSLPHLTSAGFLLLFLMMWIYYAFFEASSWQATPGKRVLRLYVTDLTSRPITFWRASVRYFARMISELAFMVGYIPAGFTEKKQALHDMLASCLVLRRP
jgi:uncharacterized RDD family membrane protein YckC